jgi:hypothetical protein
MTAAAVGYKLSAGTVTVSSDGGAFPWPGQSRVVEVVPSAVNVAVGSVAVTTSGALATGVTVTPGAAGVLTVEVVPGTAAGLYKYDVAVAGVAKPLVLTVKVVQTAPVASLKVVGKGNIDLMDRGGTLRAFKPTIKNVWPAGASAGAGAGVTGASEIVGVQTAAALNGQGSPLPGYDKFVAVWNPAAGQAEVRAKPGEVFERGASYQLRLEFTLAGPGGSGTVYSGNVAIKPAQSKVKHSLPKAVTVYQSRANLGNYMEVDFAAASPKGARIEALTLKANPGGTSSSGGASGFSDGAYWYHFDYSSQKLHIWLRDGALVKPGKQTLKFNAIYEGQGVEKGSGTPKPAELELTINVAR